MKIIIRKATINDLNSINEIARQSQELHAKLRPDIYKRIDKVFDISNFNKLLDDGIVLLGENRNKIISYAICYVKKWNNPLIKSKKVMYIDAISNDNNYMRCGIGSQMMNYIVDLAKKEKCSVIELQVNSKNSVAISFYEYFGMTEKSRTMELNIKDML